MASEGVQTVKKKIKKRVKRIYTKEEKEDRDRLKAKGRGPTIEEESQDDGASDEDFQNSTADDLLQTNKELKDQLFSQIAIFE